MIYANPFHNPRYQNSSAQIENSNPIKYNGYLIFEHTQIEFHIVKNGVCVGMNAGLSGAKKRIDNNQPPLYDNL